MEFLKETLPNGLEIVAECNADAYSTAAGFFVKAGACDETDAEAGVSHFLEHMMFKGTAHRSADDVNREFDEMGAAYNACTSEDTTIYYGAVLPEYQTRLVELLGDILRPALREEDFNTEKQVILEEIGMYEDQPPFGADDKVRAAWFAGHPLGRSVLGTAQSIAALTAEAMRDYFERRYSPGNIVLAAAGQVDFEALVAAAKRLCGHWIPRDAQRPRVPLVPQTGFQVLEKPQATQEYVLRLSDGPPLEDDDRVPAKLLSCVVGDDSGSRLFWELVDPGLAETAVMSHIDHQHVGLMASYLCCDPEAAGENCRRMLEVCRRVEEDGVTQPELDQAKNKVRSRMVLAAERPRGRLFAVGGEWAYRREYFPLERDLDLLAAAKLDELCGVARKYPFSRGAMVAIGPLKEIEGFEVV